jgi:hypothetical protein
MSTRIDAGHFDNYEVSVHYDRGATDLVIRCTRPDCRWRETYPSGLPTVLSPLASWLLDVTEHTSSHEEAGTEYGTTEARQA